MCLDRICLLIFLFIFLVLEKNTITVHLPAQSEERKFLLEVRTCKYGADVCHISDFFFRNESLYVLLLIGVRAY